MPAIRQVFVNCPFGMDETRFQRGLYMGRRMAEKASADDPFFYIPTLSPHTCRTRVW